MKHQQQSAEECKSNVVISGAYGQDAKLLASMLTSKGHNVIAFARDAHGGKDQFVDYLTSLENYTLETGDITDLPSLCRIIKKYQPNHFYHLAGMSFVGNSWDQATSVINANINGTLNCLESVRIEKPDVRVLVASSSEAVAGSKSNIQDEDTCHAPKNPYGVSKAACENLVKVYRDSYDINCFFTRCYNHESFLRKDRFVVKKITNWIADFRRQGFTSKLKLGNIEVSRDWMDARDCVFGMYKSMMHHDLNDFVFCSGKSRKLRDVLDVAFGQDDYENYITIDKSLFRPNDFARVCGSHKKATEILDWSPEITFKDMIEDMIMSRLRESDGTRF